MNRIKQFIGLAVLLSVVGAHAGTILDIQKELDSAVQYQSSINVNNIKNIIQEKVRAGLIDDVQAIKEILNNYKWKLAEQSSSCVSINTISSVANSADFLSDVSFRIADFLTYFILGGCLGTAARSLADQGLNPEGTRQRIKVLVGITLVSAGMATASTIIDVIAGKLWSRVSKRYFVKNAQSIIDELLNYLSYQEGLAARPVEE